MGLALACTLRNSRAWAWFAQRTRVRIGTSTSAAPTLHHLHLAPDRQLAFDAPDQIQGQVLLQRPLQALGAQVAAPVPRVQHHRVVRGRAQRPGPAAAAAVPPFSISDGPGSAPALLRRRTRCFAPVCAYTATASPTRRRAVPPQPHRRSRRPGVPGPARRPPVLAGVPVGLQRRRPGDGAGRRVRVVPGRGAGAAAVRLQLPEHHPPARAVPAVDAPGDQRAGVRVRAAADRLRGLRARCRTAGSSS